MRLAGLWLALASKADTDASVVQGHLLCFANREIATRPPTHPILRDTSLLGHGVSPPIRPTQQEIPVVHCTLQTTLVACGLNQTVTDRFQLGAHPACRVDPENQAPLVNTTLHREGETNFQGSSGWP